MSEWIDARMRFPCASGWYLVVLRWYQPIRDEVSVVHYNAARGFWWFDEGAADEDGCTLNDSILYWMPLPPRPGEEVT